MSATLTTTAKYAAGQMTDAGRGTGVGTGWAVFTAAAHVAECRDCAKRNHQEEQT